jgi:hypothetical protein
MGIKYEVIASSGTYTNKAGEEKKRWVKMGVVMDTRNGMSIKLESVPVGWDGWAMLTEPKQKDAPKAGFDDDEVPF